MSIVFMTGSGVALAGAINPTLDADIRPLVAAVLLFVAVAQSAVMRFALLPSNAGGRMPPRDLAVLGFAFAEAPAIYGLVAGILTGWTWLPFAFGAIALGCWVSVARFLRELPARDEETFPRL